MKQINLLPNAIRQKAANQKLVPYLVISVVLAGVVIGGSYYGLKIGGNGWDQDIATATARNTARHQQLLKEQQANQLSPDLQQRIAEINAFSKSELNWNQALAAMGEVVNKDIALTNLVATPGVTDFSVTISGEAPSNVSFANFVAALQTNKNLSSAKVDSYSYTPTTGKVTFSITYKMPEASLLYVASSTATPHLP